jgi:hypothetical protein
VNEESWKRSISTKNLRPVKEREEKKSSPKSISVLHPEELTLQARSWNNRQREAGAAHYPLHCCFLLQSLRGTRLKSKTFTRFHLMND